VQFVLVCSGPSGRPANMLKRHFLVKIKLSIYLSIYKTRTRAPPDTTPINLVLCLATCKLFIIAWRQFLASLGCRWISDWESRFDWNLV